MWLQERAALAPKPAVHPNFSQASCLNLPQAPMLNAVNHAQQGHNKCDRLNSLSRIFPSFSGLEKGSLEVMITCGSLLLPTTITFVMPILCIIQLMCLLLTQQQNADEQSQSAQLPAAQVRLLICRCCCCGIAYNGTAGDININVVQRAQPLISQPATRRKEEVSQAPTRQAYPIAGIGIKRT